MIQFSAPSISATDLLSTPPLKSVLFISTPYSLCSESFVIDESDREVVDLQ